MNKSVTILKGEPTIAVIADMTIDTSGVSEMVDWVALHRPECMPEYTPCSHDDSFDKFARLFPHDLVEGGVYHVDGGFVGGRELTHNELLVELAGRKCYDSFGAKAGQKTNREYIANTQAGDVPHSSIMYHAKMTFFFAGISRRVSHEIIRNYVGADRDEEGSPSQESTRFTHHYGFFVEPPRYATRLPLANRFALSMQRAYEDYLAAVEVDVAEYAAVNGEMPKGMERKRIYEAASSFLPHQAETSFVWTTNPAWIAKFCRERDHDAADLEIRRFAKKLKKISVERWPNLFPQGHMWGGGA